MDTNDIGLVDYSKDYFTKEQLEYWTKLYSIPKETEKEKNEWLVFGLEKEYFSVSMDLLDEIALVENGVGLPHTPGWVLGLINLRGEAVLLLDMGQIIGLRASLMRNLTQRILIFKGNNGRRTAFLVDSIEKVVVIDPHTLNDYSDTDGGIKSRVVVSIAEISGKSVSCIDISALLSLVEEM